MTSLRSAAARALSVLALAAGGAATAPGPAVAAGLPDRDADPVVLTGGQLPALLGSAPGSVVAFRWGGGDWHQVPVQVDERAVVDYRAVRQTTSFGPFHHLAYTDPGTYAGADPDPGLDGNDEVVAMAKDAGGRTGESGPAGVRPASRSEIEVSDPLSPDGTRYLYLFRSKGGLDPAAGKAYVDYSFALNSGDYRTTYDWNGVADDGNGLPANRENSTVSTPYYSQRLLSRWVQDVLRLKAGGATGVDVLDGDKVQVSYSCGRSELTFSRGGGGFIVNRSGPVRAIRSYIGANSGTYTQRDDIYYEQSSVTTTYLRVHPGISTISQFLDYSPAAAGMTYRNSAAPSGVTINGVPDPGLETGNSLGPPIDWEQASGPQGTVTLVTRVDTDVPGFTPGSYYQDDATSPSTPQCGGYADAQAWGSSGTAFSSSGQNTDPTLGPPVYDLTGTRTSFYGAPGGGAGLAALRSSQVDAPLVTKVTRPGKARLEVKARDPRSVESGEPVEIVARVRNKGRAPARKVRVCASAKRELARTGPCERIGDLGAGDSERVRLEIDRTRAGESRSIRVRVRALARAPGAKPDSTVVEIPPSR